MTSIHPTAIVAPGAELAEDVTVGPFCVVGDRVRLAEGVVLDAQVVVQGRTHLGSGTRVHPFAVLGGPPQDGKHDGSETRLEIGAGCQLREHVTVHVGTCGGGGVTRVGDGCLLMVGSHVGHDCRVGHRCTLANAVHLGGHCVIGDGVTIGALTGVHQLVRIGDGAFIGGGSMVDRDVLPSGLATGNRATLRGINLRGLRRRGVGHEEIREAQALVRRLFGATDGTLADRIRLARAQHPLARRILEFVGAGSDRRYLPAQLGS